MGRNFLVKGHFILHPIQGNNSIGLPASQGQISFPHPVVEVNAFLFESVLLKGIGIDSFPGSLQTFLHGEVQEKGQIRLNIVHGSGVHFRNPGQIQSPRVSLINRRGVGKPITEDDFPLGQGRRDHFPPMLHPGGGVEQELGHGVDPGVFGREKNLPDFLPDLGPPGFPRKEKGPVFSLEKRL